MKWFCLVVGFLIFLIQSPSHSAPALRIEARAQNLAIVWSDSQGDYLLETTDALGSGREWWAARLAQQTQQGSREVSVAPGAARRFFRLRTNDVAAWIQTATGPISNSLAGAILPHEHVFTDLRGPTSSGYGEAEDEDVLRVMKPLLEAARDQGVGLLVECTSIGVGRNVPILRRLAQETGLPIVIPTGVYGRAQYAPPEHRAMTEDALAELFSREILEGIEDTGVKAGFIKIATGDTAMTSLEEKFLRAAGRAARDTGAIIASHTTLGSNAKKQTDILEGISPKIRFLWVHAQAEKNRRWHRELAARGVFIEFDSLGWSPAEDPGTITAIKELIAAGFADRILLSHDAGWYQPGSANGGTQKPYTYLLGTFVPKLRNAGLDEATIGRLTRDNPWRAFTLMN